MRVPIICMDGRLRDFAAAFRPCFSRPQHRYFEIVLLALLLCQEAKTLTGLVRQVSQEHERIVACLDQAIPDRRPATMLCKSG